MAWVQVVKRALLGSALGVAAGAGALGAQASGTMPHAVEERPALVVSAESEVRVAPDRAQLTVSVETRGRTSQLAGSENARIVAALLDALRRQGVESAQLQTRAAGVMPEYQYPREGGRPTVTGYVARNEIGVEVRDLAKLGGLIDAALASGATNVGGPQFLLSNPDSARRLALESAVKKAMADAQVMARAAGVRVGRILELTSDGAVSAPASDMVQVRMRASVAEAAPTQIESGLITIRSSVRLKVSLTP